MIRKSLITTAFLTLFLTACGGSTINPLWTLPLGFGSHSIAVDSSEEIVHGQVVDGVANFSRINSDGDMIDTASLDGFSDSAQSYAAGDNILLIDEPVVGEGLRLTMLDSSFAVLWDQSGLLVESGRRFIDLIVNETQDRIVVATKLRIGSSDTTLTLTEYNAVGDFIQQVDFPADTSERALKLAFAGEKLFVASGPNYDARITRILDADFNVLGEALIEYTAGVSTEYIAAIESRNLSTGWYQDLILYDMTATEIWRQTIVEDTDDSLGRHDFNRVDILDDVLYLQGEKRTSYADRSQLLVSAYDLTGELVWSHSSDFKLPFIIGSLDSRLRILNNGAVKTNNGQLVVSFRHIATRVRLAASGNFTQSIDYTLKHLFLDDTGVSQKSIAEPVYKTFSDYCHLGFGWECYTATGKAGGHMSSEVHAIETGGVMLLSKVKADEGEEYKLSRY